VIFAETEKPPNDLDSSNFDNLLKKLSKQVSSLALPNLICCYFLPRQKFSKCLIEKPLKRNVNRVARFFLVQNTKTGKIHQITTNYTKCQKYD
jgi:hypothetical protein